MNLTLFMQQSIKIYESIFWLPRGSQLALGKGRSACTAIGLSMHSFPSEDAELQIITNFSWQVAER